MTQRSGEDCLLCAFAMLAGRTHEEVAEAARLAHPGYDPTGPMTHSLMRRVAHGWGLALISSIYMDWRFPGIVGVLSRTEPGGGHALLWDGVRLIDPKGSDLYDLGYVEANAIEFTQRASALAELITLDRAYPQAAHGLSLVEHF